MPPPRWLLLAGLPAFAVSAYFVAVALIPPTHHHLLFWETGIVELGTAALFALAGVLAVRLARRQMPAFYRYIFLLLGVAALLAALEEVSYGQHLFGWNAGGWFAQNNHQQETNLHNLGGDTARRILHQVGGNGIFFAGVILPAMAMWCYGVYRPGHWTHYLMPRTELMPIALLEVMVRIMKRGAGRVISEFWKFGLDELRECLWAGTLLAYVLVISLRLATRAPETVPLPSPECDQALGRAA